ncbi:MAG: GNAT family N-acetyltransferase [Chloroflexi bacterium]|nr:GNAT family N-acetyltransferase [Chloroflexota bacterium]
MNQHIALETSMARLGKSCDTVARLVDEHTTAVQSWLPTRTPHATQFKGLGVSAGSSGIPVSLLNLAVGCHYPPNTSGESIDADIQAMKAFFAERGMPWYWWIGPHPYPRDIAQRLKHHSFEFAPPSLPAMAASLPHSKSPPLNPDVQVWQAIGREDLEAASTIRRIAFSFPDGVGLDYFEAMSDDWLCGDPARLYMARLADGPPAAIGALIVGAGMPGVYIMATLPDWGRRGLGKAILARILSEAVAEGHDLIGLTAGTRGYPLYRQFGFEHIFDYAIYQLAEQIL